MSLEYKNKTNTTKSPARMAALFWEKENKERRKKMSLHYYYMQRSLLEMFGVKNTDLAMQFGGVSFYESDFSNTKHINKEMNALLALDLEKFEKAIKKSFETSNKRIKEYIGVDIDIAKDNTEKSINLIVDAVIKMEKDFKIKGNVDEKASLIEDRKDLILSLNAIGTQNKDFKNIIRRKSLAEFENPFYLENKLLLTDSADVLKAKMDKISFKVGEKLNNTPTKMKLKMN